MRKINFLFIFLLFIFFNSANAWFGQSGIGKYDNRFINVTGDTMTGDLSVPNIIITDTATIQGSAFSVGSSTFIIKNGIIGIGTTTPQCGLSIGASATSRSLSAANDLFVGGKAEFDGVTYFDNGVQFYGSVGFYGITGGIYSDITPLYFGSNNDAVIRYSYQQSTYTLMIGVGAETNSLVFMEKNDMAFDFEHGPQTNPTIFIHSTNQTTDEWMSLTHDGTNAKIMAGKGNVNISSSTTSGYSLGFAGAFETLPTSGHEEGTMAYQLSDHTLYISTEAVTSVESWKPVW